MHKHHTSPATQRLKLALHTQSALTPRLRGQSDGTANQLVLTSRQCTMQCVKAGDAQGAATPVPQEAA